MYNGKHKDLLLDGRWKVIGIFRNGTYTLENIYNHNTIDLTNRQIEHVVNGSTTVSQIMCRRIGGIKKIPIDNKTLKGRRKQIERYAK